MSRLWPDPAAHRARLESAASALNAGDGKEIAEIVPAEAFLGGGSAPEAPIPGEALALPGSDGLLARLRQGRPPVVGYLRQGRLLLDLRTVAPEDDEALLSAVRQALAT
jgi:L-seryl-tRNA(Ser) seleniumtransferase